MAAQVRNTIFCLGVSSPLLFQPNSPFFLVSCLLSFLLCFFSSWGTASPFEASFPPHSPLTCKSLKKCKILRRFGLSINACPKQWENINTSRLSSMSTKDISYVKGNCVNTKLCKFKQWTPKYFWSCQAARIFPAGKWECGWEDNDGEFESPAAHSYFLDWHFQIFHLGEITS